MKKNKNILISLRVFIGVISILFFQFLSSTDGGVPGAPQPAHRPDGDALAGLSSADGNASVRQSASFESTWLDFSGEIVFAFPMVEGPETRNSKTPDNFPVCGFNSRKIPRVFSEGVSTLLKPPVKSFRIVSIGSSPSLTASKFRWPVTGSISSGYGLRRHPVTRRRSFHAGIDIRSKYGTPVVTPSDGVVINSSRVGANGRMVKILTPGGLTLSFAHLSGYKCFRGQQVRRGQIVGLVGSSGRATGPHLHFTVQKNGRYINPMTCLGKK